MQMSHVPTKNENESCHVSMSHIKYINELRTPGTRENALYT